MSNIDAGTNAGAKGPFPARGDRRFKVFYTGADPFGWALSEDLKETLSATREFATPVPLAQADIVHTIFWAALQEIPQDLLSKTKVISNLSGEWQRYEEVAPATFLDVARKIDLWVVRSTAAQKDLAARGRRTFLIPYTVNTEWFRPLPDLDKARLRRKYAIPGDSYLIGNFMRDSLDGALRKPKHVKGPDIFAEIVEALHKRGRRVHVLLAGPRRHWLRDRLKASGVPCSFAGWRVPFEDMRINKVSRPRLNVLYNLLDLSLVTSRSEAGPHAILEAGASLCPQLSSRVGIAPDLLSEACLYDSVEGAVSLIEKDIETGFLRDEAQKNYRRVLSGYTAGVVSPLYRELYSSL
jgi:glycosyltransferase involved in cell wall biosynthesis